MFFDVIFSAMNICFHVNSKQIFAFIRAENMTSLWWGKMGQFSARWRKVERICDLYRDLPE